MDDYLSISVVVVGRPFKLRVKPAEEEIVRQAVKEINDKVSDYQQQFPSKDKQDFLSMILLQEKVDAFRKEGTLTQSQEWSEKMDELDAILTQKISELQ